MGFSHLLHFYSPHCWGIEKWALILTSLRVQEAANQAAHQRLEGRRPRSLYNLIYGNIDLLELEELKTGSGKGRRKEAAGPTDSKSHED